MQSKISSLAQVLQKQVEAFPIEAYHFWEFYQTATLDEFVQSQVPFYFAVERFPRLLCLLGAKIPTSASRLKVIENLFEEHGNGQGRAFHTETFRAYLKALGFEGEPTEHVAVSVWFNELFAVESPEVLALRLAGVEFIYTRVCAHICQTLVRFDKLSAQPHYQKHESLDVMHASELVEVFESLTQTGGKNAWPIARVEAEFWQGAKSFLLLLERLAPVSLVQAQTYGKESLAFYYSREDSGVELEVLRRIQKADPKVLVICSGGEHAFEVLRAYPKARVVLLDINPHQIELSKEKLTKKEGFVPKFGVGKFECLFACVQKKLGPIDALLANPKKSQIIQAVCEQVFNEPVLEAVFTKEATRYSKESFVEHFDEVFQMDLAVERQGLLSANMANVLGLDAPRYQLPEGVDISKSVSLFAGTLEAFWSAPPVSGFEGPFDVISLSNIGDWMQQEDFAHVVSTAKSNLSSEGVLVLRKLLGDYQLSTWIENGSDVRDETGFYTAVRVGK